MQEKGREGRKGERERGRKQGQESGRKKENEGWKEEERKKVNVGITYQSVCVISLFSPVSCLDHAAEGGINNFCISI